MPTMARTVLLRSQGGIGCFPLKRCLSLETSGRLRGDRPREHAHPVNPGQVWVRSSAATVADRGAAAVSGRLFC
jgi:hypothetical protein